MKQTLKYILERLVISRKFAEEKHSVTIALASGVIVFSSYFISNQRAEIIFVSAGSIVLALISVLYSFLALSARRVKVKTETQKNSGDLIDYKSVADFGIENYLKTLKDSYQSYRFDQFDKDLAMQIISTAKVTKIKFSYFNIALIFLALSIICCALSICLLAGV